MYLLFNDDFGQSSHQHNGPIRNYLTVGMLTLNATYLQKIKAMTASESVCPIVEVSWLKAITYFARTGTIFFVCFLKVEETAVAPNYPLFFHNNHANFNVLTNHTMVVWCIWVKTSALLKTSFEQRTNFSVVLSLNVSNPCLRLYLH